MTTAEGERQRRLYSYVVDHDEGGSPHASGGLCTLAKCKDRAPGSTHRNIIEMAQVGDWIVGTGGVKQESSAGHGRLIYAMRITEKLSLPEYRKRYPNRRDSSADDVRKTDRFALLSKDFYYFGRNAVPIPEEFLKVHLEKRGPRYRCDFDERVIHSFEDWLRENYKHGVHGPPCKRGQGLTCAPRLREKSD